MPTPTTVASPSVSARRLPSGVTLEIADHLGDLPFYNEELDGEGVPAEVSALRALVAGADRVLAVTPEYNGTMPAVLNNAIDWLSRPFAAGAIKGKPFAVIGATPTRFGGKWAHDDTRRSAGVAGADVLPEVVLSHSTLEARRLRGRGGLRALPRRSRSRSSSTTPPPPPPDARCRCLGLTRAR